MILKSIFISIVIFHINLVEPSSTSDDICAIKRNTLKDEWKKLRKILNVTNSDSSPKMCADYQKYIVQMIQNVNEDSFVDSQRSQEFQQLKKKFENDWNHLETSFIDNKQEMEDQFRIEYKVIQRKIIETDKLIDDVLQDEKESIERHKNKIKKFDKCNAEPIWNEFSTHAGTYKPKRRPSKSSQKPVLCPVTHKWFNDLKILVDSKVSSSFELSPQADCEKKRKWLLKITEVFSEAIKKVSMAFDVEAYKIGFERLLSTRRQEIEDFYLQMRQEHQRVLKAEDKYLQTLNSELQKVKHHFERLKVTQNDDLEHLGLKLMGCGLYGLALELVHEVDSEDFMKQVFIREYDNATTSDKAEKIMELINHIQNSCAKFRAYLILYSIVTSKSHVESPTIVEIINKIRKFQASSSTSCQIQYDQSKFSSSSLATDPIVNNILAIWSDSVKVGNAAKILKFNDKYPQTFEEILPELIRKSYTGNNLGYLLHFKDQLIWLSHKYIALNILLDIAPPTSDESKNLFKESVKKTADEMALHGEHQSFLEPLKRRMRNLGMEPK